MIAYVEKGAGLHAAIVAAGHSLEERSTAQGSAWVSDDDAAVQSIIDAYPISATRAEKKNAIERHAQALLDVFVGSLNYSAAEMSSWPALRAEAEAFAISQDPASAPMIGAEAAAAGVPLAALVARVAANAAAYSAYLAAVKGARTRHKQAVDALTDFAEVARYDFSAGWPG